MMLANALAVILVISLVQADDRDGGQTLQSADNQDVISLPTDNEDDILDELNKRVASVVINKDGDETYDENAINELEKIMEDEEKHDYHPPGPDDIEQSSPQDDRDGAGKSIDDTPVKRRKKRAAILNHERLWEKGVVPYVYNASLSQYLTRRLRAVMNYYEQATCLRFIPYYPGLFEDYGLHHEGVLRFLSYSGCWSTVGENGYNISKNQTQGISACSKWFGVANHEIGHAIGQQHEQHRSDKDTLFLVYRNNVKTSGIHWSETTSYKNTNNTFAYAFNSVMQYTTYQGSINGYKTMITFDKDLRYLSNTHYTFIRYLDGQTLNSQYQCAELRCPNHPHKCKNRGYVAYLNDAECRCVCPWGLGGDTCEEEYVPEPISSWPSGSYCLAADNTECNGTPLLTGYRREHLADVSLWHYESYFSQDVYNSTKVYIHRFCCSDDGTESTNGIMGNVTGSTEDNKSYDWPPGTYCIFMYKDECPSGFVNGSLRFDDENTNNQNELGGDAYPSGVYDNNTTEFRYCCRDDGSQQYPMVMQNQKPFVLLPGYHETTCQEVAGMISHKLSYGIKPASTLNESIIFHPKTSESSGKIWIYYCHYTPRTYGCGEIVTLNDTRRSVTIKSPNYPDTYNSNTVCSWTIKIPENTTMKVEFTHFNISVDSNDDCEFDYLEVRHWNPESPGRKFCGDQFPRGMVTYQNHMLLELQTSDLTPATGFEATISIVEASDFKYRTSTSYAGNVSYTQQYEKCLRWDEVPQCPYNMFSDTTGLLGVHNFCRNPVKDFSRPWCYVDSYCYTDICDVSGIVDCYDKSESCATLINDTSYCGSDTGFEHCHKSCGFCGAGVEKSKDCKMTIPGKEYRGRQSVTRKGLTCQRWDSQSPHEHSVSGFDHDENYCRNDGSDKLPWCYTTDPDERWDWCDIPFCEVKECKSLASGMDYGGHKSTTVKGVTCQRWDSQTPNEHSYTELENDENYCRNSRGEKQPWCYTIDPDTAWDWCDIPFCEDTPKECKTLPSGADYRGNKSTTVKGVTCQRWDSQTPNEHSYTELENDENYCRNPRGEKQPWCYTIDPDQEWDYCDIPFCEDYAPKECKLSTLGVEYLGQKSVTRSGYNCQRWDSQHPHTHKYRSYEKNYCRNSNTDPEPEGPWCYTENPSKRWEYCDIPLCGDCQPPVVAESMVMTSHPQDMYMGGDVITYKEKYTSGTQTRMCLSTGEWTGSDDMFSGCPDGWSESLPGRCYKLFTERENFYDAQKMCASSGGRLAIPSTEEEQNALEVVLPKSEQGRRYYIGLKSRQWIDGRSLTYTKWYDPDSSRTCFGLLPTSGSYYWDEIQLCSWKYQFACERPVTCGDGYYASGDGVCYKYHGGDPKLRDDAQAVCECEGGQLAVGSTEQEHYAIVAVLPWPGSANNPTYFGLGRRSSNSSKFEWINGSPVNLTRWAPDYMNYNKTDDCVSMTWIGTKETYMWTNVECGGRHHFVCQKPQVSTLCSDSEKDCNAFKSNSTLCTQQNHKMYAHTNCHKTCGLCK